MPTNKQSLTQVLPIFFGVIYLMLIPRPATALELEWTGRGVTKKAFMSEIAAAYKASTGIVIKLSGGGATKGIRSASLHPEVIGGTCRHWLGGINNKHPQEKNARLIQVAWDGLVVVTHPANPIDNISLLQLKKILNGEITSWQELGGLNKRITLITREGKNSGTEHMLRRLIFNNPRYEYQGHSIKVKSTGPLEKMVEKIPTSMGIDGVSSARRSKLKILSLDNISPTQKGIASGSYPLFRPLYIAINHKASPEVKQLVEFMLSPEGQDVIDRQGTVNLEQGKNLVELWEKKKHQLGL